MRVTRAEALNRVRLARVGRMATVTPEGRPHVARFVGATLPLEASEVTVNGADDVYTRSNVNKTTPTKPIRPGKPIAPVGSSATR
jgi:hypothetical protein